MRITHTPRIDIGLITHFQAIGKLEILRLYILARDEARWNGGWLPKVDKRLLKAKLVRYENGFYYLIGITKLLKQLQIKSKSCAILDPIDYSNKQQFKAFAIAAFLKYKERNKRFACRKAKTECLAGTDYGQFGIAAQTGLSQSTVSRVLTLACNLGYATRKINIDRNVKVQLSEIPALYRAHPEYRGRMVKVGKFFCLRLKDTIYTEIAINNRRFRN